MSVKFYPDPLTFAWVIREQPILSKYILRHLYTLYLYIKRGKVSVTYVRDGERGQLSSE